ncbi:hypothetical protein CL654_02595 [bacterium]|nr:hypothetical protein [bacterium]|tara:strand:- start:13435 stop:13803 length:369 start_codon:yes stop_codon:yes gene_type:complete
MDSIGERARKIKVFIRDRETELFWVILAILLPLFLYGIAQMSLILDDREPVQVYQGDTSITAQNSSDFARSGLLVGSVNGSKYHYPWCGGAQRIKEGNKIWFASIEEAKNRGYSPAGNCPGL